MSGINVPARRLLDLVDADGHIDLDDLPADATLAELREAQTAVRARRLSAEFGGKFRCYGTTT